MLILAFIVARADYATFAAGSYAVLSSCNQQRNALLGLITDQPPNSPFVKGEGAALLILAIAGARSPGRSDRGQLRSAQADVLRAVVGLDLEELAADRILDADDDASTGAAATAELHFAALFHLHALHVEIGLCRSPGRPRIGIQLPALQVTLRSSS